MKEHGGEDAFNVAIKKNLSIDLTDLRFELFLKFPEKEGFCRRIAGDTMFFTDKAFIIIDGDDVYKFARHELTPGEQELASGNYRIAPLPISELQVKCHTEKCKTAIPKYKGIPLHLDGKHVPAEIDEFRQLPSFGTVEVYLTSFTEENDEEFYYLLTYNGVKVNYVRLGDKFTIGTDYSVIKTIKGGKQVNYAIKPNGIIIKTE